MYNCFIYLHICNILGQTIFYPFILKFMPFTLNDLTSYTITVAVAQVLIVVQVLVAWSGVGRYSGVTRTGNISVSWVRSKFRLRFQMTFFVPYKPSSGLPDEFFSSRGKSGTEPLKYVTEPRSQKRKGEN